MIYGRVFQKAKRLEPFSNYQNGAKVHQMFSVIGGWYKLWLTNCGRRSQFVFYRTSIYVVQTLQPLQLGVKIRNLKIDFKTRGTWRRMGNEH